MSTKEISQTISERHRHKHGYGGRFYFIFFKQFYFPFHGESFFFKKATSHVFSGTFLISQVKMNFVVVLRGGGENLVVVDVMG